MADDDNDGRIVLNGISGVTGRYLVDPFDPAEAVRLARGSRPEPEQTGWLRKMWEALQRPFLGLPLGVDPTRVDHAGWAVVFAQGIPDGIRDALGPLIEHRRRLVPPDRFKELEYRPGEGMKDWLRRHGVFPGSVAPTKVPYYVLLVGDPDRIPFEFQYLLDIEYAVGRLCLDTPEDYRRYAEGVVDYETAGAVPNAREVVYWAPRHAADRATQLSVDKLITPLFEGLATEGETAIAGDLGFRARCLKRQDATKASLAEALHGRAAGGTPAMLMTASHGMGWPLGHADQESAHGALLTQDWSGFGSIVPAHYLTAAEITDDARLHGLVAFFFACYGAGTPRLDPFLKDRAQGPTTVAERPFVAALPRRLLSHPNGPALAVIGHVERAWGYSIQPPGVGPQLQPFRNLIGRILSGEPIGHATKDFGERYAALSTDLLSLLDETQDRPRPPEAELAWMWIERNDAQNYVVLGDPAARVRADLLT